MTNTPEAKDLPSTFTHDGVTFTLRRGRTVEYVLDGWALRSRTDEGRYHEAEQLRVNHPNLWARVKAVQCAALASVKNSADGGVQRIETTRIPPLNNEQRLYDAAFRALRLRRDPTAGEAVEAPAAPVAVDVATEPKRVEMPGRNVGKTARGWVEEMFLAEGTGAYTATVKHNGADLWKGPPLTASPLEHPEVTGYTTASTQTEPRPRREPRPPRPVVLDLHPDIDPDLRDRILIAASGVVRCPVDFGARRTRVLGPKDLSPEMATAIGTTERRWAYPKRYRFYVDNLCEIDHTRIRDEAGPGVWNINTSATKTRHGWQVHVKVTRNSKVWRKP
jgi:hypothetical protein